MSDWMWGPGIKPKHWRTQMAAALGWVEERTASVTLALAGDRVNYEALPAFMGCLGSMVQDGRLRLLRSVSTVRRPGPAQIARLRQALHEAYPYFSPADFGSDSDIRRMIFAASHDRAATPTLSSLGREGRIQPLFMPAVLGVPAVCKALGKVVFALAANLTRNYKVERSVVPAFSGTGKLACPLLDPGTTYAAFAANAGNGRRRATDRTGRGYLMSRWLAQHWMRQGYERELLQRWAQAGT
jgi:hypothetical protein